MSDERVTVRVDFIRKVGRLERAVEEFIKNEPDHPRSDQLIDQEEDVLDFLRDQGEHLERIFGPARCRGGN